MGCYRFDTRWINCCSRRLGARGLGRWFAAAIGTLMIIGAVATNVDIYTPVWIALLAFGYAMGLLNRIVSLVLLAASGLFAFSWGLVEEKGVVAVGGYLTLSILMTLYECNRPSDPGKPKDTG